LLGFFEICDEDNSGTIDKKEFYNMLKLSIVDYDDRSSLRNFVNEIFKVVDKDSNGEITKEEMK
jgi:Ca2+-binding EF-hand superfamily protein